MKHFVKKLISMILTLLVVSFLVFLAFEIIPGDPAVSKLGNTATPERVAALRHEYGLDRPFLERYFEWGISCLKGDFGTSYSYNVPVSSLILDKLPITLTMSFMAFIMIIVVSLPLGVFMAKHFGKKRDKALFGTTQIIMAIPSFFLGIIFTYFFGLVLHWFVPGGYVSYKKSVPQFVAYLVFPAISIALPKIAMATKLVRQSIIDESKKDYVRTAYARGNSTMSVMYRHVLRNALIPFVTFIGMTFIDMIAGSIVIEKVFNIYGLGRMLLNGISSRDYPVVEAVIMIIAFTVIIVNFIVDYLYRLIDPRTKTED